MRLGVARSRVRWVLTKLYSWRVVWKFVSNFGWFRGKFLYKFCWPLDEPVNIKWRRVPLCRIGCYPIPHHSGKAFWEETMVPRPAPCSDVPSGRRRFPWTVVENYKHSCSGEYVHTVFVLSVMLVGTGLVVGSMYFRWPPNKYKRKRLENVNFREMVFVFFWIFLIYGVRKKNVRDGFSNTLNPL